MMKDEIERLIALEKDNEAIEKMENYLKDKQDEELLLRLGELYYKNARNTDALNTFNVLLRLNPHNRKAGNYVTMINSILDYFCKDLLNP